MLSRAADVGEISGAKICIRAPMVTHLLFAYYSILFCKNNLQENKNIMTLLEKYKCTSDQQINWTKISITFGRNVPKEIQLAIMDLWGLASIQKHANYLGLPSLVGPA